MKGIIAVEIVIFIGFSQISKIPATKLFIKAITLVQD